MKVFELLIAGKANIDTPEKWTKGVFARNADLEEVKHVDGQGYVGATCFCSLGAVHQAKAGHDVPQETVHRAIDALYHVLPEGHSAVPNFNDSMQHADVMKLWDRAIERAKVVYW